MINSAKNIPVEKLLGKDDNNQELIYKIPPYQREYSWGKEQWENLFDDINENESGYFLGSIICINEKAKDETEYLSVIDGQQRLTTISILLSSLLQIINLHNQNNPNDRILDLGVNEEYATLWSGLKKYIFPKELGARLTLSIQNLNFEDYTYLLFTNNLINPLEQPKNFGNRRISKAYEYFKYRLLEVDEKQTPLYSIQNIFDFLKKVSSAMIVKIDVKDIASAFTLFESINNRGMPLTPIDLIKNSIIGKFEKNPAETNKNWQTIVRNIESYEDQVRYLRHYYHAFQKDNKIGIQGYIKATKSNIIKIYSEHIKKDVGFIFNELIEKSKIYTLFVAPENIDDSGFLKYKNKLVDLQRLGVAPSYSLLLYLFSVKKEDDFTDLLNFLENWFIRRHLTDYPATNKLDQIFLDLVGAIYGKEYNFESIKTFMTTKERYKNDDEFQSFLLNGDIYTINTGATRCLLTKLEKFRRTRETEVDFWALSDNKKLIWSIEHIMPQNPDAKTDWYEIDEETRKLYLHKLGNLTLTCYNSKLSNKSFKDKSSIMENGNDVGLKSGNVKINEYLKEKEVWTIENIKERTEILADEIIKLLNG